jgi:cell wall assembly regulator SMI1
MRTIKDRMYAKPNWIPIMEDEEAHNFVTFIMGLPHENLKLDIITLRKAYDRARATSKQSE